jgi:cell wall-associated NlpC family hydrolase
VITGRLNVEDPRARRVLHAVGVPYSWGAGALSEGLTYWPRGPKGLHGGLGWDCGGLIQACWLVTGQIAPDAWPDKSAHDIANACEAVKLEEVQVGDVYLYGSNGRISHITYALGGGMCLGANGGGSTTNGDDPKACVQIRPWCYRSDLVTAGRLAARFRPAT